MSLVRFNHEVKVALNRKSSLRDRRWAIWRCCYSLAGLVSGVTTEQVYDAISRKVGFSNKKQPKEHEFPSEEMILESMGIILQVRFRMLENLSTYRIKRSKQKLLGCRHPQSVCFDKSDVFKYIEEA